MAAKAGSVADGNAKTPRTERGRRTLRKLLDAAAVEFGEKGFHEASVSSITRRAGVALGSFYTYFDSKDAVFRALVRDMSSRVRDEVAPAMRAVRGQIAAERAAQLISAMQAVPWPSEVDKGGDPADEAPDVCFGPELPTGEHAVRHLLGSGPEPALEQREARTTGRRAELDRALAGPGREP
jgi:AcrR family transcriptional regulator